MDITTGGPGPAYMQGRQGASSGLNAATPSSPIHSSFQEQAAELIGLAKALYGLENRLQPVLAPAPPSTDAANSKNPNSPQLVVEYIANHSQQIRQLYALVMSITERLHV